MQNNTLKKISFIKVVLFLLILLMGIGLISQTTSGIANAQNNPKASINLETTSYNLDDNTGYYPNNNKKGNPLEKNYATISLSALTERGEITRKGSKNGYPAYGIILGDKLTQDGASVTVQLKYNYDSNSRIKGKNGNNWEFSFDTAKSVSGITVGEIKSGALLVQKSYDGKNWTWPNTVAGGDSTNYHTTDLTANFKPSEYYNKKLSIYTPSGEDISKGVYVKVLFAYEIRYEAVWKETKKTWLGLSSKTVTKREWRYRNILEESVFYLASDSAEIAFRNASQDNDIDQETSEIVQLAGTIKNGDGTLYGFRLNKLNNQSFNVLYRINNSAWKTARDGEFFAETGRYDFKVTTSLGTTKLYSIYVDNRDVNGAIENYFGNNLITSDSKRIFSTVDDVPVYVAGQTYYHINPVNQFTMPLAGTIKNLDTGTVIPIECTRAQKSGTINEPGEYEAEFYSNKNFYGDMSGDAFRFIFRFTVIPQSDIPNPMINKELLNGLTGFSDFKSGYYGVSLKSAGEGKVTYAFADHSSAYDFAYIYERGLVTTNEGGGYVYKDFDDPQKTKFYASQFDVLEAVNKFANQRVERRYFNATEPVSYQTIDEYRSDILSLNLACDVVVISTDGDLEMLRGDGDPFLNGRMYRFVSEDGTISEGLKEIKFIKIADFESDTIKLIHEATGTIYDAYYGSSVARQLEMKNAPSGRYKIVESTKSGDKAEYYAIYMRPGEMTGELQIEKFADGILSEQRISQENNELRQQVRGFIIKTALNLNDPYSIIKIVKNNDVSKAKIYQIDEINELVFDENGEYRVYMIDRLGNSYSVVFDVIDAVPAINITYETADAATAKTQTVFVGQTVTLPVPAVENEYYEFIGWEYNGALIKNDTYSFSAANDVVLTERLEKTFALIEFDSAGGTTAKSVKARVGTEISLPSSTKSGYVLGGWASPDGIKHKSVYTVTDSRDLTLTAVWHYPNVKIDLYDGARYTTYTVHPDDKQLLPFLSKAGYKLFGWFYSEPNGSGRFYVGQITSVPNVQSMRLDAIWLKNVGEINASAGSAGKTIVTLVNGGVYDTVNTSPTKKISLPSLSESGMDFFGWMYERAALSGTIYRNGQFIVPNVSQAILKAVWKTSVSNASASAASENKITSLNTFEKAPTASFAEIQANSNRAFLSIMLLWAATLVVVVLINAFNILLKPKSGRAAAYRKKFIPLISVMLVITLAGLTFAEWPAVEQNDATAQSNESTSAPEQPATSVETVGGTVKKNVTNLNEDRIGYDSNFNNISNSNIVFGLNSNSVTSAQVENLDVGINFTDEELFLCAIVLADYMSLGYNVFPAYVQNKSGTIIYGLAYTEFIDSFKSKNPNDKNIYYACGFAAYQGQEAKLTDADMDEGLIITPTQLVCEGFGFVLSFEYKLSAGHYIAHDKYVVYGVTDYTIHYQSKQNAIENYIYELGTIYSYDLERTVFDPELGNKTIFGANSINTHPDYEISENAFKSYINQQNANGLAVDTAHITYISRAALNEYMLNKQAETFLGVDVEDILLFESQLSQTQYYAVMPDGSLQAFELPPDPAPTKASWLDRLCGALVGALVVAVGVIVGAVITVATCGAGSTVGAMISGALIGSGIEVFMQTAIQGNTLEQVNWLKVGVAAVSGALCAIPGIGWFGAAMIGGATNAAMTAIDGGDLKACLTSFVTGVATGVIIHGATKLLNKASSSLATKLGKCFAAGTAVLALVNGVLVAKNIEDIKPGDMVASRNEITGAVELKKVTQTYVSEHNELVSIGRADGQVTVSSKGHPYYVIGKGYIEAQNLRAGDKLLTVNGEAVIVEFVQHEILETPRTLYNFAIEGNHNYYIAGSINSSVETFGLVHNACTETLRRRAVKDAWRQEQKLAKENGGSRNWSITEKTELIDTGKVSGYEGHHINNVKDHLDLAGNPDNIRFMERTEHLHDAIYGHGGNWRNETHGDLIDRTKLLMEQLLKK